MKIEVPQFPTRKELFTWLIMNKERLNSQAKLAMKLADDIAFNSVFFEKGKALKAEANVENKDSDLIQVRAVINTTNIIDSHSDLHIPGLWDKSLKESGKRMLHLQEHDKKFQGVIADGDDLKAFTQTYSWKELGFSWKGETEALVFDSNVRKDQNEYMFKQYSRKKVKNHSVGMYYVKIVMAINDEDYGAEYEAWEKYIKMAVNPEVAEAQGYFWAVTEAKAVEGSAVLIGSNYATPTIDMKDEPGNHSEEHIADEPRKHSLNIKDILNHYNL